MKKNYTVSNDRTKRNLMNFYRVKILYMKINKANVLNTEKLQSTIFAIHQIPKSKPKNQQKILKSSLVMWVSVNVFVFLEIGAHGSYREVYPPQALALIILIFFCYL